MSVIVQILVQAWVIVKLIPQWRRKKQRRRGVVGGRLPPRPNRRVVNVHGKTSTLGGLVENIGDLLLCRDVVVLIIVIVVE